jgi:hypothetical protein
MGHGTWDMGHGTWDMGLEDWANDDQMTHGHTLPPMPITSQTSPPVGDLKELIAWQVAMDFAEGVYRATRRFPMMKSSDCAYSFEERRCRLRPTSLRDTGA